MGWTEYAATHYYQDGSINRKAECDDYFEEGLNRGYYKVVKSALKGSVYYGAIMSLKRTVKDQFGNVQKDVLGHSLIEDIPESERSVYGVVILTYCRDKNLFGYKVISEDMGPAYCYCPKSVLDALTPTDDEYALDWRQKCTENITKPSISKLPVGTIISFEWNERPVLLRKSSPMYQFKTAFWMNDADGTYMKKKNIPKDFKIVKMG